jgi:hypothetical protein
MSTLFRGRRAATIENDHLRVTVLEGGGHIAEVFDKGAGVNPLWIPPWPSIEPSAYAAAADDVYGASEESQLLSGIMGHNLCLDIFGGPSAEEYAAGLQPHGEASIVPYRLDSSQRRLAMAAALPEARLNVTRELTLHGRAVRVVEAVENLSSTDRPVGWTEHVTLGPPFLENGVTEFRTSARRSRVFEGVFGAADYLVPASDFDWPHAPRLDGGYEDLQVFNASGRSGAFTAHQMNPDEAQAFFVAFSPRLGLAFGYVWKRGDFPWMGIWEENRSRTHAPWNGLTLSRGMEFGASPFPESRRAMIERGRLFGMPTYRWIPAKTRVKVEYWIVSIEARQVPRTLEWPSGNPEG